MKRLTRNNWITDILIKRHLIIFLVLLFFSKGYADPLKKLQWPNIYNFSNTEYNAERKNWSIDKDQAGNIYIGNNSGLLTFNGQSWDLYKMPNKTAVRAVKVDKNNRIYTGSYEEFGFWEKDEYGILTYTSLTQYLTNFNFHNEEIWKIIIHKEKVYFQAFSKIFIYDGKKVSIINPSGILSCFTKVNDTIYVHINNKGLYVVDNKSLKQTDNSAFFKENRIKNIIPHKENKYLIATFNKGIYTYQKDTKVLEEWGDKKIIKEITNMKINRLTKDHQNNILVGTIINGIYVLNPQGQLVQVINQINGLQNNTILGLFYTDENHLWVGMDNGIDLIDFDSDVSFYFDKSGVIGSVYSILIDESKIYLGTNRGLFFSKIKSKQDKIAHLDFELIEGSQGQVWSLYKFNDQIFCGHNEGTYLVKENGFEKICFITGGFEMERMTDDNQDYLIQSTYSYLVIYKLENNQWQFSHVVKGFIHPSRYLELDHLGNIWAGHLLKGLYKLRLNDELNKVVSMDEYGKKDGFISDYRIKVFSFNNRIIFLNEGKVYTYDDLSKKIIPYELPIKQTFLEEGINKIFSVNDKYTWFLTNKNLVLYKNQNGRYELEKAYPLKTFKGNVSTKNLTIYPVNESSILINMNEGIALIDPGLSSKNNINRREVQINRIQNFGEKDQFIKINKNKSLELPYRQNSIMFKYSYPRFGKDISFMIKLSNIDSTWRKTKKNQVRYDRLPPDNYTFQVKAIDEYNNSSKVTTWSFEVLPPIYLTFWAKVLYVLIGIGIIYYIRKYYKRRLRHQEVKLKSEKERALIEMKNKALEKELQQKTEKLSDTTLTMIKKNELLMNIRDKLSYTKSILPGSSKQINRTINLIDKNISNDDDWKIFENNFEQAHQDFLKRIKREYPDLTPSDLKLCAFLRMNLSSKKISLLLGISTRGVENHRYRLRKKLNLKHDDNLTEFIMNF